MKEIILLRHAKSSWDHRDLDDFDRPLNEKGINDIKKCVDLYKTLLHSKCQIICSTAKRTRETCIKSLNTFNVTATDVNYLNDLYHADVDTLLKMVNSQENKENSLIVIGHNNGITDFANYLTQYGNINHMPTYAAVKIKMAIDSWQEVSAGLGTVTEFYYPKMIK